MHDSLPQPAIFFAVVIHRATLCREHFELTLRASNFPHALPGQFIQVLCRDQDSISPLDPHAYARSTHCLATHSPASPFLRRPFSIASLHCDGPESQLKIIGRIVGPGTAWLDARRPGHLLNILGPLGRPFAPAPPNTHVLLIAGGVGLPPIRCLAEQLAESRTDCTLFFGAQSRDLIPFPLRHEPSPDTSPTLCIEPLSVPAVITTDDGSCGFRGRITDALARRIEERTPGAPPLVARACGPEPMLHAVAEICRAHSIPCEVALERVMGCGMGTCQSCVVPVLDPSRESGRRFALCCTDGPVFNSDQVIW